VVFVCVTRWKNTVSSGISKDTVTPPHYADTIGIVINHSSCFYFVPLNAVHMMETAMYWEIWKMRFGGHNDFLRGILYFLIDDIFLR